MIAEHIILMHVGTVATIPAGWKRTTALDGYYPKTTAAAVNPNVPGGNAQHSHTSPAHGHTMVNHTHLVVTSYESSADNNTDSNGTEGIPGSHRHNDSMQGVSTSGGDLSSVASTYAAISNDPPYFDVIFIEPDGAPAALEANIITLWSVASVPGGWSACDGAGSTPDLRNRFLRGAGAGLGAGATGGSTQNIHPLTHTHSESSHTHQGQNAGIDDGGGKRGTGGNNYVARGHKHTMHLNAATAGGISTVTLTTTEVVEPAYKKLMAIKNTSGVADQPQSIIGLYLGDLGTIPAGWKLCDGNNGTPDMRGQWLKIANNSGEIGVTGGSNTHTHAAQAHGHTGGGHVHTGYLDGPDHSVGKTINGVGGSQQLQNGGNVHRIDPGNVGSTAASWNNSNTTADSSNNEPPFLTVAYVMYTGVPIADERGAELRGCVATNSEVGAELTAIEPQEERRAEITCKDRNSDERGCELSVMVEWTRQPKPVMYPYQIGVTT